MINIHLNQVTSPTRLEIDTAMTVTNRCGTRVSITLKILMYVFAKKGGESLTICYSIFASRLNGKDEFGETLLIIEKLCTVLSVLFNLISGHEKITTEDGIDG